MIDHQSHHNEDVQNIFVYKKGKTFCVQALNTYLYMGIMIFLMNFTILCGVAMGRCFACHMQSLSYIIGEVFCVWYAKSFLYNRGDFA